MNTILKTHTPVTQEKNLGISQTRWQNPLAHGAMVGLLAVFSYGNVAPVNAASSFYCVDDQGLNDSQFCHGSLLPLVALGPLYENCDIEALDISQETGNLYAAAGDNTPRKSHLYYVYKGSGDVVDLGNIGGPGFLEEVDALSFHPVTDELWGWAQGEGLFVIPTLPALPVPAILPIVDIEHPRCLRPVDDVTIPADLVHPHDGEVEDITWNWTGDVLYAVENLHTDDPDSHGDDEDRWPGPPFNIDYDNGIKLWAYDAINGARELCPNLAPSIAKALEHEAEIEGLEALPNDFLPSIPTTDDLLIATFHGPYEMYYAAIIARPTLSTPQCNIWIDRVEVPFNDIEGIAYFLDEPVPACPSVVGGWTVIIDWNCDGEDDTSAPMAFLEDSIWQLGSENGGTWEQNDCNVEMSDDTIATPVIWTGTLEGGNNLSGEYSNGSFTGCWKANRSISSSFTTSESDPDKSGNGLYK
ncbi:hypothetical protein QUF54_00745 [Candidatus Marithioploca araucensis]|uniref:Uncharacterized protein n=1 Tax=Candidatus Marithioploca araucensis TaxID=70273 RepID=A0ABT7VQB2_9GAMM|nr:hypothetical protein [Candidatus Marithioploca araucensis]